MDILNKIFYFIIAIGVLVSFHEFGHFWVARRCGVKVLRFSIGFGKPLFSWYDRLGTEYVIALIPLGGYVRMLDEREDEVAQADLPYAFNRKPLWQRISVVLAGPVANFLLAILIYWVIFVHGVTGVAPVIGEVLPGSVAERAGLQAGQQIVAVDNRPTPTYSKLGESLLWRLGDDGDITFVTSTPGTDQREMAQTRLGSWDVDSKNPNILRSIGVIPEYRRVQIYQVMEGMSAHEAGLQEGDLIERTDDQRILGTQAWIDYINDHANQPIELLVERDGRQLELSVTPKLVTEKGQQVVRIGVSLGGEPWPEEYIHTVRLSVFNAIPAAANETWEKSLFTLQMLKRIVTGLISFEHLSGPLGIATVAGQSAESGLISFLGFLALLSISLGVLNLLPIPVLDGGHLMYYLIEAVKGSPVSEKVQMIGYRVGLFMVMGLMVLALSNDVRRLLPDSGEEQNTASEQR